MRRSLFLKAVVVALLLINSSAHAGVITFSGWVSGTVLGPNPGEKARISEGILFDSAAGTAGAPTYDYIFYVANTGSVPIAAYAGGPGTLPVVAGGPIYNSDTSFALGGFPAAGPGGALPGFITPVPPAGIPSLRGLAGGYGGANNPFRPCVKPTPYTPLFPDATCGLSSPNFKYWGFEVWSTNAGNGYLARWYNLVGNQVFTPGLVTRFDIDSTFGPIPGGSFPDPFSLPTTFVLDFTNGDEGSLLFPPIGDPANPAGQCNPSGPDCSPYTLPSDIAALNFTGFGAVPEPGSFSILGAALIALLWIRRRRRVAP